MEPLPITSPLDEIHVDSVVVETDYLTAYPDPDEGFEGFIFVGAFDRIQDGDAMLVGSHLTPEQAQEFADQLWDMAQAVIDAR